jgi:hypothetical protein
LKAADTYDWDLLGDVAGNTVADFGCGNETMRLVERGAGVDAPDGLTTIVRIAGRVS